jgi:hypothetical protein
MPVGLGCGRFLYWMRAYAFTMLCLYDDHEIQACSADITYFNSISFFESRLGAFCTSGPSIICLVVSGR